MGKLDKCLKCIDNLSEWSGKFSSWALVLMMAIVFYDVIMRRFLSSPSTWGFEITYMLWGAYFIMVTGWTEQVGGHLNVDVVYRKFPERLKLYLDVILYISLCLFWVATLIKGSFIFAVDSWSVSEHTQTPFAPPLYPLKIILLIGFIILWLQCAVTFIRSLRKLIKFEKNRKEGGQDLGY
ncbi:MAG: TRAP transporter small permease subunit [Syntrophaceae bacterium]|nr:TRAP transporter small permease subunit [Syntrophaceae bacterium]